MVCLDCNSKLTKKSYPQHLLTKTHQENHNNAKFYARLKEGLLIKLFAIIFYSFLIFFLGSVENTFKEDLLVGQVNFNELPSSDQESSETSMDEDEGEEVDSNGEIIVENSDEDDEIASKESESEEDDAVEEGTKEISCLKFKIHFFFKKKNYF